MGDIQDGDEVLTEKGAICRVLKAHAPYEADRVYHLMFDDGSEIITDAQHLWHTFTAKDLSGRARRTDTYREKRQKTRVSRRGDKKSDIFYESIARRNALLGLMRRQSPPSGSVKTTQEIVDTLLTSRGRANHAIPVCEPLNLPDRTLPLAPYLLGVWLGDGTSREGSFTSDDNEIVQAFHANGFLVTKTKNAYGYYIKGLGAILKKIGVLNNKHVPPLYLRGSYEQRLAILQGLMDTDGTAGKDGGIEFTSTTYLLAYGVAELARSLGSKVYITKGTARLNGKYCGPKWVVRFTASYPAFRLARKANRQSRDIRCTSKLRYIVSAQIKPPCKVRCLTVDNPTSLYLCTESFIATHNTWTLLLEPIYHKDIPGFRAVMFRRTMPNITNAGSMWDQSAKLYPHAQAKPNASKYHWTFPSEARVEFASLQHAKTVLEWKSAEIALLGFDQIEEFTEDQFWYMISRNRSTCGVPPYVRCTVNPVPADDAIGGWVHKLIQWWLDPETGLPIKERDGIVRWFIRINEEIKWYNSKQEAVTAAISYGFEPDKAAILPKSLSFIAARLEDNKKLMEVDPGYYANLMSMPLVERERLYGGNWNVKPTAGRVFNRAWFTIVPMAPLDVQCIRYWDKAGTEEKENPNAAYTAGVKMGYSPSTKGFYVLDVVHGQWQARERENVIRQCAEIDGSGVTVWIEQEPGSGGKESAKNTIINTLAGYACFADRVKGDKYIRSQPFAAMVQAYNVYLVKAEWNDGYLTELHAFEPEGAGRKDRVDASSGAFNKLTAGKPMDLVTSVPLTEEERQKELDEKAQDFARRVQLTGSYFPGD